MKKEILIVKNMTREDQGLLEELLKDRGIGYTVVDLDQGQKFPPVEIWSRCCSWWARQCQ